MKLHMLIGLATLLAATMASANFSQGFKAYNQGHYGEALAQWLPLAETGHGLAQYNLGIMYEKGLGLPLDPQQAQHWYRLAAAQKLWPAQYALGRLLSQRPDPAERRQALSWYQQAAENGSVAAATELGFCYLLGRDTARQPQKAVAWFTAAAQQGDATAQYNLATLLSSGIGVKRDPAQAAAWFGLAAAQGQVEAQYRLAEAYAQGQGLPRDSVQAEQWYKLAAQQDHPGALAAMAQVYAQAGDDHAAFSHYQRAAAQGHAEAQYGLGVFYAEGRATAVDARLALRYLALAANQAHRAARLKLAALSPRLASKTTSRSLALWPQPLQQGQPLQSILPGSTLQLLSQQGPWFEVYHVEEQRLGWVLPQAEGAATLLGDIRWPAPGGQSF